MTQKAKLSLGDPEVIKANPKAQADNAAADQLFASIQEDLDNLVSLMEAKGYVRCSAELMWTSSMGKKLRLGGYADEDFLGNVYDYFYPVEETFEAYKAAVKEAEVWVAEMESITEKRKQVLMQKISDTIAYARAQGEEIAPEVDFIKPMLEMMKKLSENVITDQRGAPVGHAGETRKETNYDF